jgi:hypothetical protein
MCTYKVNQTLCQWKSGYNAFLSKSLIDKQIAEAPLPKNFLWLSTLIQKYDHDFIWTRANAPWVADFCLLFLPVPGVKRALRPI